MNGREFVFLLCGLVAVASAVGVVAFRSPVRSAMSLVLTFFSLAIIYFNLGAELLGVSQIMVYAGAIMVLFLFVVMILRHAGAERTPEKRDPRGWWAGLGALVIAIFLFKVFMLPLLNTPVSEAADKQGTPQAIGPVLFTTYVWPFEVASVLLLIGVVGSIMLAKRRL
ncbi:MAG TPA: NADH-quinone oxidoreductase subunit J [Fimbriimonadaceae bacterium]|nr:NADH-quinone oxidoreductase subunit J [Fimbriimonadaceae bacterium]